MGIIVSIIGSFKQGKYYKQIIENVNFLLERGFIVQTPKYSSRVDFVDNGDFAIFDYDDKSFESWEIQMVTLEKIVKSNAVYVCDVDGYVGKTTSYEIGFCYSRNVPLYFFEKPKDLPIFVPDEHIVSIEEFSDILDHDLEKSMVRSARKARVDKSIQNMWPSTFSTPPKKGNRLMICGSMAFWNQMSELKKNLIQQGLDVLIPEDESTLPSSMDESSFLAFKKRVSNAYLKKIRDGATSAILVYNEMKNGKRNYIGANTFVEIAMAFAWNRKIYLLNDIYDQYRDELLSWNCIPLSGDIGRLTSEFSNEEKGHCKSQQLSLFD